MKYFGYVILISSLLFNGMSHAAKEADSKQTLQYVPHEVVVKFKASVNTKKLKTQYPDLKIDSLGYGMSVIKVDRQKNTKYSTLDAKEATETLLKNMRNRKDVEYAQLNYIAELAYIPNDPLYSSQWHYPKINMPQAWNITRGSSSVRIGILDTGRTGHPDIRWSSLEFNAANPGSPAIDSDTWRHGTHVAGIAAGRMNNYEGGAGVCPNCQLINVKIGSPTSISVANIIRGVEWAVENNVDILNMSFEFPRPCTQSINPALRESISNAVARNVSVVTAAGNNHVDVNNVSPASCPGAISVAATDRLNNLAPYSSFGSSIGISAPGGETFYGAGINCPEDPLSAFEGDNFDGAVSAWTTSKDGGNEHCYRYLGGTSMAAPHVAGALGLMLSINRHLRPDQLRASIRSTASGLNSCGKDCGPGLLDSYAAIVNSRNKTTGPCSANNRSRNCVVDSLGQFMQGNGRIVESVYASGYLWQFNQSRHQINRTTKLSAIPRYAEGPCSFAPAGGKCKFDSVTILDYPGIGYVESITAYGRGWNFDEDGEPWPASGFYLSSIARFANGPCLYASNSLNCTFDTRNLIDNPAWGGLYESITAYGRYWIFNSNGSQIETGSLNSVSRYASGPCAYAPNGQHCRFDARDLRLNTSGKVIETITAYGRYFEWNDGSPTAYHGQRLESIAHMR